MAEGGKRYSAGAIFLQVVPVFANVQNAIADEAKNIDRALGDSMEKSGEKAGDRAGKAATEAIQKQVKKLDIGKDLEKQVLEGVDGIDKALDGINTRNLGKKLRAEIKGMRADLDELKDVDLTIDDNLDKVRTRVAAVQAQIEDMRKRSGVFFDIKGLPQVYRSLAGIQAAINKVDGTIDVKVDTKSADREMGRFEQRFKKTAKKAAESLSSSVNSEVRKIADELKYLENLRIGVDISGGRARAEVKEIAAEIDRLSREDVDIDVKIDLLAALAELKAFEAELKKIDGQTATANVKTNARKAGHDAEQAANSFRSFNIILLAVSSVGPALVPVLAAIAGGLLAIGPAAAVAVGGLGAVLVGFSGIGDALTALGNQQDQAATNAQTAANRQRSAANQIRNAQEAVSDAVRNAARAAEDAAERVADARRNAARAAEDAAERVADAREQAAEAIEDALERQRDAQEEYRDAVKEVAEAEQDLRDAREQAQKDAETLARRQRQNAVDERQALLDLGEAQNEFNNVMADGSATTTDREQAAVNLEQAQIRLNETRHEQVELAEEADDYARNGVDGSERVKSAQEKLTEALEAQVEAQEAVRESAEAADEARREGAEAVREALEDQNEVLSDNARAVRQALEDQAESHSDNQRAIERAKRALTDARKQAVTDLAAIDSQAQAVQAAFDKLGPAGRDFALFLFGLRSGFYEFRDAVQEAMLPAVREAIEGFIGSDNAAKARDAMVGLARGFGEFTKALSVSFQGPVWAAFFEMMAATGVQIQKAYGDAFISFMEALASILTTAAPFALRFAEGLADLMDRFADWAASPEGQQQILDFLAYVERIGPDVLSFFSAFAGAVVAAAKALAPYGELVLGALTNILEFIENSPEAFLTALLTGATVVLFASQLAYGVMNLMMAGAALWATAVGPWVFLIVGVGIALGVLYKTNEDFRDFIDEAWGKISAVFKKSWHEDIKPALTEFWEAIKLLWDEVLQPFIEWLGPIIVWMFEKLFPLWAKKIAFHIRTVAWIIRKIIVPAFKEIRDEVSYGWNKVIKPTWDALVKGFRWVKERWVEFSGRMKKVWAEFTGDVKTQWDKYGAPIMKTIREDVLPALETAFKTTMDAIGDQWERMKKLAANPIKFVIEEVINNGLIAGYNKVAGWVNAPELGELKVPEALNFATGGVLPGYTPGRDVHTFRSPTAGTLNLSGGEAIMRPEWTAAMGPDYVNRMNKLAATGGVNAVRQAVLGLGGYWMGGILPLLNGSVSSHGNSYGHPAFDLNYPGYADYGKPARAWKSGVLAQKNYIGDASYGRWTVVNHAGGQSSLYAHLSAFPGAEVGAAIKAGQTIGYIGDIGNTGTPPTSHLHFEIKGGNVDYADVAGGGDGKKRRSIPGWLMGVVKDPLGAFKGWVTDPIKNAAGDMVDSPLFKTVTQVPKLLGEKVVDKVWDVVPGWVKTAAGWAGDAADWAVGGVKNAAGAVADAAAGVGGAIKGGAESVGNFLGFAEGGILPYNGTMMYDAGGYLPPGMTTVMNLTGKPEPVFTNDQWDEMSNGGAEGFTYAPTFQGSNLTAADVVDDLDFARRKIQREGKYGRSR